MNWSEHRSRHIRKELTFSPDEWRVVRENWRACRVDPRWERFGDWAREALSQVEIRPVTVRTDPAPLRGEIRRIGVNINEIVRLANTSRTVTGTQISELTDMLAQVRGLLTMLYDEREQATLIARAGR